MKKPPNGQSTNNQLHDEGINYRAGGHLAKWWGELEVYHVVYLTTRKERRTGKIVHWNPQTRD